MILDLRWPRSDPGRHASNYEQADTFIYYMPATNKYMMKVLAKTEDSHQAPEGLLHTAKKVHFQGHYI